MSDRCEPPKHLRRLDGWHWVRWLNGKRQPKAWDTQWGKAPSRWNWLGGWRSPEDAAESGWEYIEPVALPEEVAALRAEAARLREALETWVSACDRLAAFEREHPNNVGKQWDQLFEAKWMAEDAGRAALSYCGGTPNEPGV